jgi:hypothetical protein
LTFFFLCSSRLPVLSLSLLSVCEAQMLNPSRKIVSHSYFVVMINTSNGLEAIVQPERTRRDIVSMIKSGEYRNIEFIHFVDGLFIEDLTSELIDEAEADLKADGVKVAIPVDRQTWQQDHARDLRKNDCFTRLLEPSVDDLREIIRQNANSL